MRRKELLKTEPCEPPEIEEGVKAVSQLVEIDGSIFLNIDFFDQTGTLKARYFADREKRQYTSFVKGKWRGCSIENVARLAAGRGVMTGSYYSDNLRFHSKSDEKRCREYLGADVEWWESQIRSDKSWNAHQRKVKRIDDLMAEVPPVPDGVDTWLQEEVFRENFLFFRKEKERYKYSCTACGCSSWRKTKFFHNDIIQCPKCGAKVTAKGLVNQIERKEGITILQNFHENEWVERGFHAVCRWEDGRKEISLYEDIRAVIRKGQTEGKVYYGQYTDQDEFSQDWWDTNPKNRRWPKGYLYPGNVREVLAGGPLEHSGLHIMAEKRKKLRVNSFIRYFQCHPYVEYLIKMGLTKMAVEIVEKYGCWSYPSYFRPKGKKATEILNIDGNRLNRIKQMNGGLCVMDWLRYEVREGIKISQDALIWLEEKSIYPDYIREILNEVISVNRMVNYLRKQRIAPSNILTTWKDYLRMAAEEGMDTQDDIIRFPKDLKARHDQLVELRNERSNQKRITENQQKYAEFESKMQSFQQLTADYFYQEQNYRIFPAKKCEELIKEGRALHHCVGASDRYMEKMAKGESWILFLRKQKEPETPYYTIEISLKDDRILQCYSAYDRKPDYDIISKVLERFKTHLKKSRTKAA